MIGAFAYLIVTSTRNKFASQARRIRNPRYAIACLLGVAYFWMVFGNRAARGGQDVSPFDAHLIGALVPVVLLAMASYMWIFGADRSALAFSQAEVSFLFSAPVSRRGLIVYKLVRAQAAVVLTSVLWLLLFSRGRGGIERGISYWALLSTISMHRLGVALVRASHGEHGVAGMKKSWGAVAAFGAIIATFVAGVYGARASLMSTNGPGSLSDEIVAVLTNAPVSWALYPFRIAVAPSFARTTAEWVRTIGPAIALLLLHVAWVLHTESAFEEAAAEASATRAKRIAALRSRGVAGAVIPERNRRRTIPLAPTGLPAVAIVWKNILFLIRTDQVRTLVGLPAVCAIAAVGFAGRSSLAELMVLIACVVMAIMTVIFGPVTMRNDLRGDLGRIPMMKTFPISGNHLLLAEVSSSAIPTATMQFLLAIAGVLALSFMPSESTTTALRAGVLVGAPFVLLGLNLANFTIHNGLALLFPAWVKTGESGVNGIEAIGQTMLTSIITLFLLAVLLLLPVAVGAGVYFYYRSLSFVAVAGAGIVGGALLCVETYLLIGLLGGTLDRLEPMHVA